MLSLSLSGNLSTFLTPFYSVSYEVSNLIFRPLKVLLRKLRNMQYQNTDVSDTGATSSSAADENQQRRMEDTSAEVEQLKKLFQELLDTRRFEINDFLEKEDSEAIMDLA